MPGMAQYTGGVMKQTVVLSMLAGICLVACSRALTPSLSTPIEPDAAAGLIPTEVYRVGEPLAFQIVDTVHVCEDALPYRIVQITQSGEREVNLEHSCAGVEGAGIDQFCENGEVKTVQVVFCSDAVFCEEQPVHETIKWDQQEFVQITEECAGQSIHREIEQQVPEGKYQVRVHIWQDQQAVPVTLKEFMITVDEPDPGALAGTSLEEAALRFLQFWALAPYRNEHIEVLEDNGTFARVEVVAQFRGKGSGWIDKEAVVGCQRREEEWLCDRYSTFRPVAPPAAPGFERPEPGETIDRTGSYLFAVKPAEGAEGYLWGFFQNGEMVWENLRDEGQLSGTEYTIAAGTEAHSRFVPGELKVSVRASIDGQWTDAAVVTVHLR